MAIILPPPNGKAVGVNGSPCVADVPIGMLTSTPWASNENTKLNMELLEIDSYEEILESSNRRITHIRTYAFGGRVYKAFFERTNGRDTMHDSDAYLQVLTDGGWSFLEGYLTARIWIGQHPSLYGTWEESKDHAEKFFEVMKERIEFYHGLTKSAYKKATVMSCILKGEWTASVGNSKPYHEYEQQIYCYRGQFFRAIFSYQSRYSYPDMTIEKWREVGWATIETTTSMKKFAKTFNEHGHTKWRKKHFFEIVEKRIEQIYCRTEHGFD